MDEDAVEAELSDEAHRAHAARNFWLGYRNHLREKARELGYALALHGSVKRDVDLIAFPWVEEAVDAETLVRGLLAVLPKDTYIKETAEKVTDWSPRPHGRQCCTIHLISKWYKSTYLDISVAPRILP